MPYLIDGHNLIPKLGLKLDAPDDEMELVAILQEFTRLARHPVEVFFDAAPAGRSGDRKLGTVTAHFVRAGSSADAAIRSRLTNLARAARNWTVVSSDHEVQAAARRAHASVLASEEFARQLRDLRPSTGSDVGERNITTQEVDEWLKRFGARD
jgi:predicted RNA-binding protein with PIN domain